MKRKKQHVKHNNAQEKVRKLENNEIEKNMKNSRRRRKRELY